VSSRERTQINMRMKNINGYSKSLEKVFTAKAVKEEKMVRRSKLDVERYASWNQWVFYAELHGGRADQKGSQYVAYFD